MKVLKYADFYGLYPVGIPTVVKFYRTSYYGKSTFSRCHGLGILYMQIYIKFIDIYQYFWP